MAKKLGINTQDKLVLDNRNQRLKGGESMMYDASLAMKITKDGVEIIKDFKEKLREKEIQELALKIFKRNLGFTFKPDVEPEVIQELVESEPFQNFIELATKEYDKRQKALANIKYPVIEIKADGKSGMAGGAWCMAFVYSKYKGNFVVKGYVREVEEYLKKNYTHYFYNLCLWNLGGHRDIWRFWKTNSVSINEPSKYKKGVDKKDLMFRVRPRCDWSWDVSDEEYERQHKEADEKELRFKRMPKRWIPEFENF